MLQAKLDYLKQLEDSTHQNGNGIIPHDQTVETRDEIQKTNNTIVKSNTAEDGSVHSEVTLDVPDVLSQHKEDQEQGDGVTSKGNQEAADSVESKMRNGEELAKTKG